MALRLADRCIAADSVWSGCPSNTLGVPLFPESFSASASSLSAAVRMAALVPVSPATTPYANAPATPAAPVLTFTSMDKTPIACLACARKRTTGRRKASVMQAKRERMERTTKMLLNHSPDTNPCRYARIVESVARLATAR
eukprot:1074182-Rhodomonas_salina.2